MKERTYIRDGRAPIPKNEITSKVMSAIKDRNTKPEVNLRQALREAGLAGYRLHWKKVPGRPDIAYVGKKLAIFVNGCYWHRCPYCQPSFPKSNVEFWTKKLNRNQERDKDKLAKLEELGWRALTIWECEIKKDVGKAIGKVKLLL